jgi:hypothetical protein
MDCKSRAVWGNMIEIHFYVQKWQNETQKLEAGGRGREFDQSTLYACMEISQ